MPVTLVRWHDRPGGRWRYGVWAGVVDVDGSWRVGEAESLPDARAGVSVRSRSLCPERLDRLKSGTRGVWLRAGEGSEWSASLVVGASRDGVLSVELVPPVVELEHVVVPAVDPLVWSLRELVAYASLMTWCGWSFTPDGARSGSELVRALEFAYEGVRAQFPELLDVVMITGSGLDARGVTWGHFRRDAWRDALAAGRRPEVFIGAERLATGAVLTMQTLLHECAHELAFVRDIQDVSRQDRRHNKRFVELAEELGLAYEHERPDPTIGFSAVTITPAGRARWSAEITALHEAITLMGDDLSRWLTGVPGVSLGGHGVRVPRGVGRKGTGGSTYVKLQCQCTPRRTVRAARSTVNIGEINCGICDQPFAETDA